MDARVWYDRVFIICGNISLRTLEEYVSNIEDVQWRLHFENDMYDRRYDLVIDLSIERGT